MKERGRLFVFLGPSGSGKDYLASLFIKYCKDNNYSLKECRRYLTRSARKDEKDDELHKYGLSIDEVCSEDKVFSEVNGNYVGISVLDIDNDLANGENVIFVTGSYELVEQLLSMEIGKDLCLVFINSPALSLDYYYDLEKERNPDFTSDKIMEDASIRYERCLRLIEYFNKNRQKFNYGYANFTRYAMKQIVDMYGYAFLDNFFEVLINDKKVDGPNWIKYDGIRGFDDKL